MTDPPLRTQPSPSPRSGPPVLPPLSKFYCGPAQGWHSSEPSPNQNGSTWSLVNSQQESTAIPPPLQSPNPAANLSSVRQGHTGREPETLQAWRHPSPSSVLHPKRIPETHTPVSTVTDSSANQGWDSRPSSSSVDTTTWGVNFRRKDLEGGGIVPRPVLPASPAIASNAGAPPRESSLKRLSPSSKYSSQHLSARGSATTIDVPLFLQPPLFDADNAPPLPEPPTFLQDRQTAGSSSTYGASLQPHSNNVKAGVAESMPTTTPRNQPDPADQSTIDFRMREARRPKFDPQNSLEFGHAKKDSQGSLGSTGSHRRPRFDPQNSHEAVGLSNSWQTWETPNATKHAQSAVQSPRRLENQERENQQDALRLRQDLVSPIHDVDHIEPNTHMKHLEPIANSSPNHESQQHPLHQPDGRSTTATDASSYIPATSTPESHQTTNTSFKGSEPHLEAGYNDEDSNDSFYWHSGRSSSEDEDGQSGGALANGFDSTAQNSNVNSGGGYDSTSTARGHSFTTSVPISRHSRSPTRGPAPYNVEFVEHTVKPEVPGLPTRSSSLSPNPAISYTASALGIGGPSDWEYFGDYEAEEIDDEELYAHKPRAELPADHTGTRAQDYGLVEYDEPRSGEKETSPTHGVPVDSRRQSRDSIQQLGASASMEPTCEVNTVLESRWSPSTTPTTPHANSSRPITVTSEPLPEDHRPDLDEVIRAWSDSPHVGRTPSTTSKQHPLQNGSDPHFEAAEASLASTPGENVLGIFAVPTDAPPIPRLPTSVDLNTVSASLGELKDTPDESEISEARDEDGGQVESVLESPEDNTKAATGGSSDVLNKPSIVQESKTQANLLESTSNDRDNLPSPALSQETFDRATRVNDLTKTAISRTNSPMSEFARKRQLFESSAENKPVPMPIQRKPLRDFKSKAENSPNSLRQQISIASLADRSNINGSFPSSAEGSIRTSQRVSPTISRIPSREGLLPSVRDGTLSSSTSNTEAKQEISLQPAKTHNSTNVSPPDQSEREGDGPKTPEDNLDNSEEGHDSMLLKAPILSQAPHEPETKPATIQGVSQAEQGQLENDKTDQKARNGPTSAGFQTESVGSEVEVNHEALGQEIQMDTTPISTSVNKRQSSEVKGSNSTASRSCVDGAIPAESAVDEVYRDDLVEKRIEPESGPANDPYADLDPWGRASLNRFAAMLREEARAESNKDKLNIFNVFTNRESRLRLVLYGTDEELLDNPRSMENVTTVPLRGKSQKSQHLAKAGSKRKAPQSNNAIVKNQHEAKELPPLPPDRGSVVGPPRSKLALLATAEDKTSELPEKTNSLQAIVDESEYSPGGRPLINRHTAVAVSVESAARQRADVTSPKQTPAEATPSQGQAHPIPRSNDKEQEVKNYLTNRRSVYRPFATQTAESMGNANNFGTEPGLSGEVPIIPTIVADNANQTVSGSSVQAPKDNPLDLRRFVEADFDPLALILPRSEALHEDCPRLADLRKAMDAVPDDFGFIHASVVSWDTKIKIQRESNEQERHLRQMTSEQRIDALFDDHEIGYGDIAELEGEFKQSEAARKAEEDRAEYHIFVEDVFNLVWTRLNFELDQLRPHYEQYILLMDNTLAGKDMFDMPESLPLAPTMTAFIGLHQKLEIRHQKAFEAVLERDRRLKKTEISPWYSLSNLDKVKQLEKQFEDAEKQAIISYCEQRDTRANKLMDVLDQNTLRGVGANQDYMEAIMKAVRRIASGRAFASLPGAEGPTAGIELVDRAKKVTALLATSSEQVVQTFHVADMLLNNADFEVSVAKAKVAKADTATLARLREERAKEDQKLMRDLEHRLALIREDSRRTNDEIVKLMLFLGLQNGKAMSAQLAPPALGVKQGQAEVMEPAATSGGQDPEHQRRLQKALDDAKRRNVPGDVPGE